MNFNNIYMQVSKNKSTRVPILSSASWINQNINLRGGRDVWAINSKRRVLRAPVKYLEGDIRGYPIPQYRKKNWQIP